MEYTKEQYLAMPQYGVFEDVRDAIDAAYAAQKDLMENYTTDDRDRFIAKIKEMFVEVIDEKTIDEFNETGYGRLEQKLIKNRFSIIDAPDTSVLEPKVMATSRGLTIEYRAPYGLVGALTPVTNGIITIANNAMDMIAAGNSIVFNAHPAAKEAGAFATDLVNRAVVACGGPNNLATMTKDPDKVSLQEIMTSPKVSLLIGTGGHAMVQMLLESPKKVIAAGPSNPPTIIDETADVLRAADVLYDNVAFENGMLCVTEKVAFVVESVYDQFVGRFAERGAKILTAEEAQKVVDLALLHNEDGSYSANKKYVGKNAAVIAADAGVELKDTDLQGDDLWILLIEADKDHPYVAVEQLQPVFPVVKVKDFEEAMELAVKAEDDCKHTATIWSNDFERITRFGKKINTTTYVCNGASVAATGMDGTGYGSSTIACSTGEGYTTPQTFTRVRRFAMAHGLGYVI